jgi:O-antigen ligase
MTDPTRVRSQPALTSSTGLIWIVLGSVLAVICAGVLFALVPLQPVTAWVGLVLVVVLFLAMVVIRFAVRVGRRRLTAMASVFGGMALVTLACVVIIAGAAWESLS